MIRHKVQENVLLFILRYKFIVGALTVIKFV